MLCLDRLCSGSIRVGDSQRDLEPSLRGLCRWHLLERHESERMRRMVNMRSWSVSGYRWNTHVGPCLQRLLFGNIFDDAELCGLCSMVSVLGR